MTKQTINIGTVADDGTGSTIRAGGDIVNDNFNEIYTEIGDGSTLDIAGKSITFTNKSIDASSNTLSNIPNSALTNNSITINGSSVSLGSSTTISTDLTIADDSSTNTTITSGTDTLSILGGSNLTSTISGDTISIALDSTITGLTSVQTETLTNASGNLLVDSATNILEIRGDGASIVGQLQLNCHVNTHGQIVASQPHSESATNTLTLPGGSTIGNSDATLLSDTGTQTISNKTIGVTQLTGNTRTATGDGSTTTFTVTDGTTTNNTLVFVSGSITTDYTISGTTLTFGSPPTGSAAIVIKEL